MSRDMILFDGFKKAIVFIFLVALVFGAGYMAKSCTIKKEVVEPATLRSIPTKPFYPAESLSGIKAEVIDDNKYVVKTDDNYKEDVVSSEKASEFEGDSYWQLQFNDQDHGDYCTFDKDYNLIRVVVDGKQIYPQSEVSIGKLEVQGKKDPVDYLKYYRNRIARTDNIELKNGVTIGSILFRYRDETFHLYDVRYKKRSSSVEYRHPFFEFGSEIGYLTGTNGKYLLCSPVGVYIWRIGIKPTVMVGEDLSASYGITLGVRWMP